LADSAGASNTLSGRGPQVFMLDGVPAKGKTPEQLEVALRAQIANIAKEGVSDAEMRRVKAQWMASNVYQRDSIFNQARELGSSWIEGMPLDSADRLMDRLNTITAAHVQAVAAKYFGDDTLTVATLLPQAGARAFPRKPVAGSRHGRRHDETLCMVVGLSLTCGFMGGYPYSTLDVTDWGQGLFGRSTRHSHGGCAN
jgi:zinc protease